MEITNSNQREFLELSWFKHLLSFSSPCDNYFKKPFIITVSFPLLFVTLEHEYCMSIVTTIKIMSRGLAIEHTTLDERRQVSWIVFFAFFFNYSVLQYVILLTSKLISFCVTPVNTLGSHTLSFTEYVFFNCGILNLLFCTLSAFLWSALLSLHSTLLSEL